MGKRASADDWEVEYDDPLTELATWVIALTRRDGTQVFSHSGPDEVREDLGDQGLLLRAAAIEPSSLQPALQAALGKPSESRRLSWQVHLPEAMLHDDRAKLACLLPEWDVRRGRLMVCYEGRDLSLEMTAGKARLINGPLQTTITLAGTSLKPLDDWEVTCEYSDDDVHYLELEQLQTEGYAVQRQLMVVREDRCCFIADAVVRRREANSKSSTEAPIEYQMRIPLSKSIESCPEEETAELYLCDAKRQALVLPLSSNEWRLSEKDVSVRQAADHHLVVSARGTDQLFVPLWFDLARNRFRKKRTWRKLTVGEQLAPVPRSKAAAFRVQVGDEQWVFYRSLAEQVPRTFFGKQMIADFYCARFDAESKAYEELITVEDSV